MIQITTANTDSNNEVNLH